MPKKILVLFLIIMLIFSNVTFNYKVFAVEESTPILVVVNGTSSNEFGVYMGEILKAEGFNEFQIGKLSDLSSDYLKSFSLVILTETLVTDAQKSILEDYVNNGGNLIGIHPDISKLSSLFGVTDSDKDISEGYIKIDTATDIGYGLESGTMKFHGIADGYVPSSGTKIASLYSSASSDTGYASVVKNNFGSGHSVAFSYNLCKSIVYTRQGNPALAGVERDGADGVRALDMMYDNGNSYNDKSKVAIPQADEQMRLLTHAIEWLNGFSKPLPRLWYFPDGKKAITIFTGDSDFGGVDAINDEFNTVKSYGGNASIYIVESTMPSKADLDRWISDGHEPAIHFDNTANRTDPTWDSMNTVYSNSLADFAKSYGTSSLPVSVRNHWILWCGKEADGSTEFAAQAEIEASHGIKMDYNYYSVYSSWQGDVGFENGSGLPMKFSTSNGNVLAIYQADTQVPDEAWHDSIFDKYKLMLDRSLNGGSYAWINLNFHPYMWSTFKPYAQQVMQLAKDNSIPIWSGKNMYDFTNMRDSSSFSNVVWNNNILSFNLNAQTKGYGNLTFMVPFKQGGNYLNGITKDGSNASYTIERIKGSSYAFVTVQSGSYSFTATYTANNVDQVNLQPVGNKTVNEGSKLEFTLNAAHDPDFQVKYTAVGLPSGATLDENTGLFRWTPSAGQSADYKVRFIASDGITEDSEEIVISVINPSLPKNWESIWGAKSSDPFTTDGGYYELGTIFRTATPGNITHIRVFGVIGESGDHTARIWRNDTNTVIGGPYTINYTGMGSWITYDIPDLGIEPNVDYTISVSTGTDSGRYYPSISNDITTAGSNGKNLSYQASAGVFTTNQGARPTESYQSNNYLRDIVFVPAGNANTAPTFNPIESKSIQEGAKLEFTVNATDADNDVLTYSTENLPLGAAFNPDTRTFTWIPGYNQSGTYTVKFKVTDGKEEAVKDVTITVIDTNTIPDNAETIWGGKTALQVVNDNSAYELGTVFTPTANGMITHIRVYGALGEYGDHTARIWRNSDGALIGGPYTISYNGANDWIIYDIPDINVAANVKYTVSVSTGSDQNKYYPVIKNDLTNPGSNGKNLSYEANAGVFSATLGVMPTESFSANNYLRDVMFVPYQAVKLNAIEDKQVNEGSSLSFTVQASHDPAHSISYAASGLPSEASFNQESGLFTWTPSFEQAGSYTINFKASDGISEDSKAITITVVNVNRAPVLSEIGNKTIQVGNKLEFTVNAADPDKDTLTYSVQGLPSGAAFDSSTGKFNWAPNYTQSGKYTVSFKVSDGTLTDTKSIIITVNSVSATTSVNDLINQVKNLKLDKGPENSLIVKLNAAYKALSNEKKIDNVSAIDSLYSFISEVKAQSGKKLTLNQADALIKGAQNIIDVIK